MIVSLYLRITNSFGASDLLKEEEKKPSALFYHITCMNYDPYIHNTYYFSNLLYNKMLDYACVKTTNYNNVKEKLL